MAKPGILQIQDDVDLRDKIIDNHDKLLVFLFSAKWCGPCKKIKKKLEKEGDGLAELYSKKAVFMYVDVEENEELGEMFEIKSLPTLIFNRIRDNKLQKLETLQSPDELTLVRTVERL